MRLLATIRARAAPAMSSQAVASTSGSKANTASTGVRTLHSSQSAGHGGSAEAATAAAAALASSSALPPPPLPPPGAQCVNATAFAQLLLDMHRQAGIMLLDRMGPVLVQQLAAHVEMIAKV